MIFQLLFASVIEIFEVMHLSLSHPTYPRSGTGGDYWGFARVIRQIPHPWGQFRDSKNNENSWSNAPTLGRNYADKSLQISTHCPTWGRWGLTMIGTLVFYYIWTLWDEDCTSVLCIPNSLHTVTLLQLLHSQ